MPGANLSGADLSGASLHGASLAGADLRDALLDGVDLDKADLTGVNRDAPKQDPEPDLQRIRDHADWVAGNRLTGRRVELRGADLSGAIRRGDRSHGWR